MINRRARAPAAACACAGRGVRVHRPRRAPAPRCGEILESQRQAAEWQGTTPPVTPRRIRSELARFRFWSRAAPAARPTPRPSSLQGTEPPIPIPIPIPDLPGIGGPSPPPSPICGGSGTIPIPGSHRRFRALPQRLPLSARSGQPEGDRRPRPSESGDQGGWGLGIGRAAGAARLQNLKRASSERMRRGVPGGVVTETDVGQAPGSLLHL